MNQKLFEELKRIATVKMIDTLGIEYIEKYYIGTSWCDLEDEIEFTFYYCNDTRELHKVLQSCEKLLKECDEILPENVYTAFIRLINKNNYSLLFYTNNREKVEKKLGIN